MTFPEKIAVRFTEEEADYLSLRPILRQTFTPEELIGMILTTTGKDPKRIREILHAGTLVYNLYRYWWERLDVAPEAVVEILARFPDADPTRPFRPAECAAVVLEGGGQPPRHSLEIERHAASRMLWFRSKSFWDCLLELARSQPPVYQNYSYSRRSDVYALPLGPEQIAALSRNALRFATRAVRGQFRYLSEMTHLLFLCPRSR